jgi:hypothetical protein
MLQIGCFVWNEKLKSVVVIVLSFQFLLRIRACLHGCTPAFPVDRNLIFPDKTFCPSLPGRSSLSGGHPVVCKAALFDRIQKKKRLSCASFFAD